MNMVDQNGAVTLNTYDLNGKLRSQSVGGKITNYTYDNNGNLLTQADESGVTTRTYDSLGRVTSKDVPGIGLTTYLYDITSGLPGGHLGLVITDPKGNMTEEEYDRAGRLHQVRSGSDTTTYSYFANGNRKSMAYPNGVVAEYTYYADNRLHTLANKKGNTLLSTFNYAYDGNGNMVAKLELKGMTSYSYDALGRLEQVTEPDGRETAYTFDAAGNRLAEAVTVDNSDTTTWYAYNEQNRLLKTIEVSGITEKTTAFRYDNNGNEISRLVSTVSGASPSPGFALSQAGAGTGDEVTFEINGYDAQGRLVSVFNDNCTASYTYNHDGLRASKTVTENGATTVTKFLYNSGYIVLELDGAGAQTAYNVFGGSSVISRTTAQGTDYYLYNGRGDVVQLTNSAGSVTATYDYDAFGNLLTVNNHLNPFRYCGEYWDYETKRYYFRARYYSPATGRFTQRDKFLGFHTDPLSLNRYTYAHNNPIKYIDPSGYDAVLVTMPDGTKVTATLKNGVTTLPNGDRPPVGAIVHATNGRDYQMQASGSGIEVPKGSSPATVITPTGVQAGITKSGVTTMTSTGSRPEDGWIVTTSSGASYQMNTSLGYGTPVTVVPVVTYSNSGVSITIGGYSNENTKMLDGSNIADGSFVVMPDGNVCQMVNGTGVIVEMPMMEKKSTSGVLSNSVFTPLSLYSSSLPKGVSVGIGAVGAPLSIQDYNEYRKTMEEDARAAALWIRVMFSYSSIEHMRFGEAMNLANQNSATPMLVVDVRTGSQFHIQYHALSNGHVDVEPLKKEDTDTLRELFGDKWDTWNSRPVWVTIGGETITAAIHGKPHSSQSIPTSDNDMTGHLCLHFYGTEVNSKDQTKMAQASVKEAWEVWEYIEFFRSRW